MEVGGALPVYGEEHRSAGLPHSRRARRALGDVGYWIDQATFPADEIAVRLHHRLVFSHPFANGNGRHARLMANVPIKRQGKAAFTWGGAEIGRTGDFRRQYIDALRTADMKDIQQLLAFARS